jgi:2-hydroxy-6-oxonona-2,4-dienedioate hydrolase
VLHDIADEISGADTLDQVWMEVHDARIHVRMSRQPPRSLASPPIVLIHGIGVSGRYLLPTAVRLAANVPVYVPDLPGFGLSSKPAHALSVTELADALAAWLAGAAISRATLLGNSFGCQIIAAFASRHPGAVAHVIMQGPTMDPEARTAVRQLARWAMNSFREPKVEAGPALGAVVRRDYRDAGCDGCSRRSARRSGIASS